jgi:hypothetical protein
MRLGCKNYLLDGRRFITVGGLIEIAWDLDE